MARSVVLWGSVLVLAALAVPSGGRSVVSAASVERPSTATCSVVRAETRFGADGYRAAPSHGIFRAWLARWCAGRDLGPATSPERSVRPGTSAQDFRTTAHRIVWSTRSGTVVRTEWSWAEAVYAVRGVAMVAESPIAHAWLGEYVSGHDWGVALDPPYGSGNPCGPRQQVFAHGVAQARYGRVTFTPYRSARVVTHFRSKVWRPLARTVRMWGASLVQRNAASSRAPLTGDLTRPNALWHALGLTTWPRHVDTALVDWTERTATARVQLRVPSGTLTDMVHLVAGRTWQFAAITRGQSGIGCAPVPAPAPTETSLPSTYAIGDSVMEDAAPYLARMGITVDAAVGRQFYQGAAILESIAAAGRLPANVVVGLGTNGPMTSTDLDGLLRALHGERRVVLVTVHEPRFWQDTVNAEIHAAAARWPNVRIADWYTASAGHPEWFASDGIHTGPQGGAAYASVVAAALR